MKRAMVAEAPTSGKRERILRAAIDVFAESGYFNAKVTDIAKAAGVADGTIYLYFDGKEELLTTIFREHTRNYLQSLERDLAPVRRPEERIRIAIRHHLETLGRDRALAVVAQVELRHSLKYMSLLSHQEVGDYLGILRKIVEQGQAAGVFRQNLHPQLVAKALFGVLDEMVTSWILSEKEYALGDQADGVADLVLNGLL
jgi:TetR/AcrR family transcriptional regulator, fatty acid metabolism regulator protein